MFEIRLRMIQYGFCNLLWDVEGNEKKIQSDKRMHTNKRPEKNVSHILTKRLKINLMICKLHDLYTIDHHFAHFNIIIIYF